VLDVERLKLADHRRNYGALRSEAISANLQHEVTESFDIGLRQPNVRLFRFLLRRSCVGSVFESLNQVLLAEMILNLSTPGKLFASQLECCFIRPGC
jgi:hypothetical protein